MTIYGPKRLDSSIFELAEVLHKEIASVNAFKFVVYRYLLPTKSTELEYNGIFAIESLNGSQYFLPLVVHCVRTPPK